MTCVADSSTFLHSQWQRVSGLLRAEIGEAAYRSWLRPMTVCSERDGFVIMKVPTRFMRDWVVSHYADRMRALWGGENPTVLGIDIVVEAERTAANACQRATSWTAVDKATSVEARQGARQGAPHGARQPNGNGARGFDRSSPMSSAVLEGQDGDDIGAPLDARFTFDNFVVGKPNEFAYAAARRVAEAQQGLLQPAVPLWRRRSRQDPSDACHRVAHPPARAGADGRLPVGREVHVPLHPRPARAEHRRLQGAVPLRRRADDRRRPVHQRQGLDPGGIFPHLQHAGRPGAADRAVRRQIALRPGRHAGAAEIAAELRSGRRHPCDHLRAAPRHPADEGGAAGRRHSAAR